MTSPALMPSPESSVAAVVAGGGRLLTSAEAYGTGCPRLCRTTPSRHGMRVNGRLYVIGDVDSNKLQVGENRGKMGCLVVQSRLAHGSLLCGGVVHEGKVWVMGGRVAGRLSASIITMTPRPTPGALLPHSHLNALPELPQSTEAFSPHARGVWGRISSMDGELLVGRLENKVSRARGRPRRVRDLGYRGRPGRGAQPVEPRAAGEPTVFAPVPGPEHAQVCIQNPGARGNPGALRGHSPVGRAVRHAVRGAGRSAREGAGGAAGAGGGGAVALAVVGHAPRVACASARQ